jgi:hypothetical protein
MKAHLAVLFSPNETNRNPDAVTACGLLRIPPSVGHQNMQFRFGMVPFFQYNDVKER